MRTIKSFSALSTVALSASLVLTGCASDPKSSFNKSDAARAGEATVKNYINATVSQDAKKACSLMSTSAHKRALEQGVQAKMWKEGTTCEEAMAIGFKTRPVDDKTKEMVKGLTFKASDVTAKGMVVRLSSKEAAGPSVGYKLVPKGDKWLIDDLATDTSSAPSSSPSTSK